MSIAGDHPRQVRAAGLLLAGALGLHGLRYLVAFGADAGTELDHQGHGYLIDLGPTLVALALAFIAAAGLIRLLAGETDGTRKARGGTLAYAVALLAIYSGQEFVEGLLDPGHASGIAAPFADGGWIALPLALVIGLVLATTERLLLEAEDRICALIATRHPPPPGRDAPGPGRDHGRLRVVPWASLTLAFGFASRPPPGLLSS